MAMANDCPRCNAENRAGRRFCAACGAALARPCERCGFVNQPHERFCGGCGSALEPQPATTTQAAEKAAENRAGLPPDVGERRQVTILFADLSGYTSLAAQRDPEETHAILGRFFEAVDRAVTQFGGAIERHIGDNVMGVFGAPLAHGDDPCRAVLAAGAIHRAVDAVSAEIDTALAVHIGIAAGTVMASNTGSTLKAAYGVVGSPVNLAARLQARAAPGETLVSNSVRDAVEGQFALEAIGEVAIKGLDAPALVWRVLGERGEAETGAVPLVGRGDEVKLLRSLLDGVAESGHGRVVCVRGEAGIGKTRLVQVLAAAARERGFSCHLALVLDFGTGQGRDAIRALVASLLGLSLASAEAERRAASASAVARGFAVSEDTAFLSDLLGLQQLPEQRALYDAMDSAARDRGKRRAVARLIRAASASGPLVLIVEDLHWADPATLETLAAIAEAASEGPVVLAMTSRIDGDPLDDGWRGRARTGLTTIDLGPLRPQEASELVQRLRITSNAFLARCIDRAGGNPLFLEQLLRHTQEGAQAEEVPASVQSLVLARMDRLAPRDKAALQAAAVGGQRFSLDLVRALVRDQGFVPDTLLRQQMIRPDGAEFLFAHALVRDGVYSSLTRERRRDLHRAAADWYENRDVVLRAEHLERAGDPGAAVAYRAAALAQAADYHFDLALSLAERGRAIAATPEDRFALDLLRGEYLREAGRAQESLAAFDQALIEGAGAPDRCRAHIGIAAGNRILSRLEPALSALAEAQRLAPADDLAIERAQIHYYRGNILFAQGEAERCLVEHQSARAAAEAADSPQWRARASSGIGDALYSACRMRTALAAFQDCVAFCDAHGYGRIALPNRIMIGHCLTYMQRVPEALPLVEEARAMAARAGNSYAEMFAMESLGVVMGQSGQTDAAATWVSDALKRARALGARRFEAALLSQLAECALAHGRRPDALRLAQDAVAMSREAGMGFCGPYALAVLARATDEPSLRAAHLAEGESVLRAGSVGHNVVWYYRVAGDAQLETQDWAQADRCAQELRAITAPEPLPLVEFITARIKALSAFGRGERSQRLGEEIDRLIAEGNAKGHPDWLACLKNASDAIGRRSG
jgi:class 3 adenylate cyclase/tetratricopeptide (TPR) repeat protein